MTLHCVKANDSIVFKVMDYENEKIVEVYKNTRIDEFTCEESMCFRQKYEEIFCENNILLHIGRNNYIFICEKILKISIPKDDEIVTFKDSYAIGKINTYFLLENKYVVNELLDLSEDVYSQPRDKSRVYERKFIICSEDAFDD
jgi:hypothetical protein